MGKRKKKSKSIWDRIRSNPKGIAEIFAGGLDLYAASKGEKPGAVVPKGQKEAGAANPNDSTTHLQRLHKSWK